MNEKITVTNHGFMWGASTLNRIFSGRFGVCMEIETPKERLQIRVTPKGFIRTRKDNKRDNVFRA